LAYGWPLSRFAIFDWLGVCQRALSVPKSSMTTPSIVRTSTAELYDAHVLKNYARAPLTLVRGRGARVWDDAGNAYLDFTSGIAVSALGHCHPHWVAAVQRQAGELIHVSNLFRNPGAGRTRAAHRRRTPARGGCFSATAALRPTRR
jgi:4-aminobutyrate aminotransferase-like enzyme